MGAIQNRVRFFVVEHDAVTRHQIGGPVRCPKDRGSINDEVDGGKIAEFQAIESASLIHLRAQDFQGIAFVDHPRQDPSMLARSRTLLASDDLELAIQADRGAYGFIHADLTASPMPEISASPATRNRLIYGQFFGTPAWGL